MTPYCNSNPTSTAALCRNHSGSCPFSIRSRGTPGLWTSRDSGPGPSPNAFAIKARSNRSEEHTSELQSQSNLVCRLLLEKKITLSSLKLVRINKLSEAKSDGQTASYNTCYSGKDDKDHSISFAYARTLSDKCQISTNTDY